MKLDRFCFTQYQLYRREQERASDSPTASTGAFAAKVTAVSCNPRALALGRALPPPPLQSADAPTPPKVPKLPPPPDSPIWDLFAGLRGDTPPKSDRPSVLSLGRGECPAPVTPVPLAEGALTLLTAAESPGLLVLSIQVRMGGMLGIGKRGGSL